jgi:phosphomannomutase/phosphoglucomutase
LARAKKAPKSARTSLTNSAGIWRHSIFSIGFGSIGLITAFSLLWWQLVVSSNSVHTEAQVNNQLTAFAALLEARIAELRNQVTTLAASPQVVNALVTGDAASIDATGELLTDLLGQARRVELVPTGEAAVDEDAAAPISYAAKELINRALSRPYVGPEGATLERRGYIYAAAPIASEGATLGTLFIALSPDYFTKALSSFDPSLGSLQIQQSLDGGAPIDIISWGNDYPSSSSLTQELANGSWTLVFRPGPMLQEPVADVTNLLTAFGVALVTLLGGICVANSILGRKLDADAKTLESSVSKMLRGNRGKLQAYKLAKFQAIAASLHKKAIEIEEKTPTDKPPPTEQDTAAALTTGGEQDARASALNEQAERAPAGDGLVGVSNNEGANFGIEVSEDVGPVELGLDIDKQIFRAYDIRGLVEKNLTPDVVYWIGRAFAAEAISLDQPRVAIGRDGRHSSVQLRDSLAKGLTDGGMDVLDIGLVPTPLLYFATHALDTGTGIMITGSHNPPEYNGLKMMIAGVTLAEERIEGLYQRISGNRLSDGEGDIEVLDLTDHYVDRILEDIAIAQPIKVVVDCGNGVAGVVAPRLLEELGCEVVPLYCEVDGDFPNHHPDPADPDNLDDLITVVKAERADLGMAFDGDGDRLGVVTASGEIIWPDKLMMLFSQDVVGRNPGADIIYDVKCSRHLNTVISENGGRPVMWKTGHSHIKAKMKDSGALLGGEFSGHICFGERWYGFDDAIYAAARLMEILGSESKSADELFAQFPVTFSTPEIKVPTSEAKKFAIIGRLENEADFGDGTVTSIDGVRVDYADGWGLIRASNTSPVLTLRFEADGQSALDRIQDLFQDRLTAIDPELSFR